jgi:Fungal trichothecene efflux pump (TRI12)
MAALLIYLRSGSLIVIVGTTLTIIGLTWGGILFPWKSAQVLTPLITGMCLISFFIYYEAKFPKVPTIPFDIMANCTSFSG